ncbi:MAG: rRNA maturation RNase YbeY [Candidatus Scalindua sp. AMX11]|nr:MAG: rRNA maturation RNase YbeY [Candidatus Scalindua sp.]NOG82446.1 rRNA maturation RNase YbeY [Planctomycetota bacterium]RZV93881.1 MAG: rRNA maturation RNase YbeY [Candidatus Scalindua sp. SCAELEC01]TDE65502.1 MAG: rRNA maturation RNase YbeY [Candidatus Scalindua sp. AMX11]GJQ58082.1 MAG: endoribonuclease YbeY [Candidatus Scalindua sp.]
MIVEIANLQNHYEIKKDQVKKAIREFLKREGRDAKLSIAFVDNNEIKKVHQRFLSSDEITDVISFPLGGESGSVNGEVVVSVETALEVANSKQSSVEGEIILYVIHGILHLLGFDDNNRINSRIMHKKEVEVLSFLGYRVPEIEDGFL